MYRECMECGHQGEELDFEGEHAWFTCPNCGSSATFGVSDSPLLRGEEDISSEGGQWW